MNEPCRLIIACLEKDKFKECFDRWFDELRNYITYRCGDSELATDIVQEAFLRGLLSSCRHHNIISALLMKGMK